MKFLAIIMVLLLDRACSFVISPMTAGSLLAAGQTRSFAAASSTILRVQSADGENLRPDAAEALEEMAAEATGLIERLVTDNKVMLFMKGNKMFPQCGFSNTAIQVLRACDVEFETYDVLSNEAVRQKIKEFSNWPTIPQLYVDGEFTGGSDIMIESFQSGELKTMLEEAGAKFLSSG